MSNYSIFEESKKYIPGGVNSPVRAYKDMDITPPVITEGIGALLYDENGDEYIDFVGAWGPMILGHCDSDVVEAIKTTATKAIAFGAPTKLELDLAKLICTTTDIDLIRMVNSGTEATMSAVKLARGFTGKNKIVKFAGCYHGHYEGFLVSAGSGVMTAGIPGSAGIPVEHIKHTIIAKYNDMEDIAEIFKVYGEDIACVIIEPVAGNMGVIKANDEFMNKLHALCKKHNSLLIFDEVMCGFRVAYKGAQSLFNFKPDLVTYGKIIGGGLPCGAYGGRRDVMEMLSPLGPVYQAGTMSGNPLVMAAGIATLEKLHADSKNYDKLNHLGKLLEDGVMKLAKAKNIPVKVNRVGAMLTIFFTDLEELNNYEDVQKCNVDMFKKYFKHMLSNGINLPPSQFEALFLSLAHTEEHILKFLKSFESFCTTN
ncbi:glutamate-1-semialdehyde 2,1-aminomutase [Clostridium sp.]|uniref:glutamate-1-semialdehyde 2,1-aminomutase n=1 Tax=Clostridium sp. TaxID=1506 RepID=UPI002FCB2F6B